MKRRAFLGAAVLAAGLSIPVSSSFAQTEMNDPFKGPIPDTGGVVYDLGPDLDPRVIDITKDLGCICGTCPHEPVSTCTCGTARRIRAQVALGISKNQPTNVILADVVDKFGEQVLPKPPFSGFNLVAWLGPFVVIIGAGIWLLGRLRDWQKKSPALAAAGAAGGSVAVKRDTADADPYLAAVDAELARRERI